MGAGLPAKRPAQAKKFSGQIKKAAASRSGQSRRQIKELQNLRR
ncbi:hypothetical protein RK21_00071 [Pseudomonas plecoglossicida]|nr:hypothetical protein RK21_00071 [Pseudomonas plecoglossicida]